MVELDKVPIQPVCSEQDGLIVLLGRNTFTNGVTTHVAAGVKFVDGKVTEIRPAGELPESG